jgi:hypothetical protein
MPYDRLGFGLDSTPPLLGPSEQMKKYNDTFYPLRRNHTASALPSIGVDRVRVIFKAIWPPFLLPFAVLGVLTMPKRALLAVITSFLLVLVHLAYPHPISWMPYYLEVVPIVAFATAAGMTNLGRLGQSSIRRTQRLAVTTLVYAAFTIWLLGAVQLIPWARRGHQAALMTFTTFARQLHGIRNSKAIVFVRYGPYHKVYQSLIVNQPSLEGAPIWIVNDLGGRNVDLLKLAPDRVPYLYDEQREKLLLLLEPKPFR